MAASTVYDVRVNYLLSDKASKSLGNIEKSAGKAAKSTGMLSAGMRRLTAVAAGLIGFRTAKKWLVDFNAEMEQSVTTMTTLLMQDMGGTWAKNQERANRLVKTFQKDAAVSVGTTMDYVNVAKMITGPLLKAGASMEDLRMITQGTAVAAETYGIETRIAGGDVQAMIMGNVKQMDKFARMLGVDVATWNKMAKAEGPRKALEETIKLFKQPALVAATKAYGKTWAGITSTLEDNLQRTLGAVGLPLMQAMSAEFEKLSAWFKKNPEKVKAITKDIAQSLVKAFGMAKKVFGFIIEHRKLLWTIAKAYLAAKVAGGMGRLMASPFQAWTSNTEAVKASTTGFWDLKTAGKNLIGNFSRVAAGLGVLYVAAKGVADYFGGKQEKRLQLAQETTSATEAAQAMAGVKKYQRDAEKRAKSRGRKHDPGELYEMKTFQHPLTGEQIKYRGRVAGRYTAGEKLLSHEAMTKAEGPGWIKKGKGGEKEIDVSAMLRRYGVEGKYLRGAKTSKEMRERHKKVFGTEARGGPSDPSGWAIKTMEGLETALAIDRELKRRQEEADSQKRLDLFAKYLKDGASIMQAGILVAHEIAAHEMAGVAAGEVDEWGKRRAPAVKPARTNVSVTIKQVVSDDADRFAFNLMGAMQSIARNPTQARRQIKEG